MNFLSTEIGGEPLSMFPFQAFMDIWAAPFCCLAVLILLVCLGSERTNARQWRERYDQLIEEDAHWRQECEFLRELLKAAVVGKANQ